MKKKVGKYTVTDFDYGKGEQWYYKGHLHRENDLPAQSNGKGYEAWYKNGLEHRENGPARQNTKENWKEWWINGELHREDGPACEYKSDGGNRWYLNGKKMTKKEWNRHPIIRRLKFKALGI